MSDTTFVPGTVVRSTWLNDINSHVYKGRDFAGITAINVKDPIYGVIGNGIADDSVGIAAANAAAVAAGGYLYFPQGTYRAKGITLNNIKVDGLLKSFGSSKADAIVLQGIVDAPEDAQIFSWSVTNPTNLPGTTYPFYFSATSTFGGRVSVKWFGASGNNTTDDAPALTACATALSFSQKGGTPYATKRGPVVMYFPRGNYRIGKDSEVNVTIGTVLEGQASGSNPLSTVIKDDATYGAGSANMFVWVLDNETYTDNPSQFICKTLSFIWRPSIDFSSSTTQLDTAFHAFRGQIIDGKLHDCWFLGSPQKGSIFSWGNAYAKDGSGIGIVKVNTGSDSDGINVAIESYNTFYDVCYGTLTTTFDKGYGTLHIDGGFIYQLWLGYTRNFSTHSTNKVTLNLWNLLEYLTNVAAVWQARDQYSYASIVSTDAYIARKVEVNHWSCKIVDDFATSLSFSHQVWLQDSATFAYYSCIFDVQTTASTRYFKPMWELSQYANSLILMNNDFRGTRTPGPGVVGASQSYVAKRDGDATHNGITDKLVISGNTIDGVGSSNYFLYADNSFARITSTDVSGNICYFPKAKMSGSFMTGGKTRYHITSTNVYSDTANVIA